MKATPEIKNIFMTIILSQAGVAADPKFDKWGWRRYKPRIERAVKAGNLSAKEEENAHKFLENYKVVLNRLGLDYEDLYPIPRAEKSNKEEFDWRITAKARKILRTGDPVQYVADSCGKMVLGAETAFKKLVCCISVQNIRQSAGLHPKLNGKSSGGKTWTIYTLHITFQKKQFSRDR
jgi:hypothetical protein